MKGEREMNKIKLYVDDILVYQQEGTVTPPPTPPPVTPPAPPTPPPNGIPWQWDTYPTFDLNAGQERIYIVKIINSYTYLKMSISGLTMNTMGAFTWTFPDGRILPQPNTRQGVREIVGMNGAGLVVLRAGINIPDNPIPRGNHVVRITASSPLGNYFKISIEAE